MAEPALLEGIRLTKKFTARGTGVHGDRITAVDQVSLAFREQGEIISVVGESGSGKTTLARMLLGLSRPTHGEVRFRGRNLAELHGRARMPFQRAVQPIFQDPYGIYNPFYRIERVLEVVIRNFRLADTQAASRKLMEEALQAVDLRPNDVIGRYPHQLSGGERQRVMLARIYLLKPKLIIADEPVSMIDVAVRTRFLNILLDFRDQLGISCLFITHNLASAHYLGGRLMVMCQGCVVESGDLDTVIGQPSHPYTQQLIQSLPSPNPRQRWSAKVPGPDLSRPLRNVPDQCVFAARCVHAMPHCTQTRPQTVALTEQQNVACFLYTDDDPISVQAMRKISPDTTGGSTTADVTSATNTSTVTNANGNNTADRAAGYPTEGD